MPSVAAVKIDARLDRAVAAHRLQEDGDHERGAHQHQPLDVLRDEGEVAGPVLEEPGREQRLLSGALPGADVEEERQQEDALRSPRKIAKRTLLRSGLQDPEHDEEHADGREDRPDCVEGTRRIGGQRIVQAPAQQQDRCDDQRPERRTRPAS